ncbi:unnamed protein product [Boreogadus saida]
MGVNIAPSIVPIMHQISSTMKSFTLSWPQPEQPNGIILDYELRFYEKLLKRPLEGRVHLRGVAPLPLCCRPSQGDSRAVDVTEPADRAPESPRASLAL